MTTIESGAFTQESQQREATVLGTCSDVERIHITRDVLWVVSVFGKGQWHTRVP